MYDGYMDGIENDEALPGGLPLETLTDWLTEINQQPPWRSKADRECDYYDGNQLDSEILQMQSEIGMPPAIEPLIGPTIDAVLGAEAKSRTDWRVLPDNDKEGDEVAEALNFKLNQAERHSKADDACSAAYASQIKVGLGWVEVSRESNPFKYPYRCTMIHRNEIWWDFLAKEPDLSDARYMIRKRWIDRRRAEMAFPGQAELIRHVANGWQNFLDIGYDGGASTGLAMAQSQERGWSIEEQEWRDTWKGRVCLAEVWYREWEQAVIIKTPDGRVVEYDSDNRMHNVAIELLGIQPEIVVIPRVRLSWWLGPHRLSDEPSPYKHKHFPYVPFWGKREDRTKIPYGLIRGMMYLQDEVNARISKMQWGLAAVRTTRTKGAVLDDDEALRQEVARPDADIVLDAKAMQEGGIFKVERDFELNRQQYERLVDAREGIKRTGGIYNAYMGQDSSASSGVAIAGLVEQSQQSLADINDNFAVARQQVGELLLALIIEDMAGKEETITIPGDGVTEERTITLNTPHVDEQSGMTYLDNDIERTRLQVSLQDVPSTPSFRAQQLAALSEAFKSASPIYQQAMMPHLLALMDVPNREELMKSIKEAEERPTPEQIEQMMEEARQRGRSEARIEIEMAKLAQDGPLKQAQALKALQEAAAKGVGSQGDAMQVAQSIAMMPALAPQADQVLSNAGFPDAGGVPDPMPVDTGAAAIPQQIPPPDDFIQQ